MPSIEQKLFDEVLSLSVDIGRYEASFQRAVVKELRRLETTIIRNIRSYEPTPFQRRAIGSKKLDVLLKDVREAIRGTYRNIGTVANSELKELYRITADGTATGINSAIGVSDFVKYLTPKLKTALYKEVLIRGAKSAKWWSTQAGSLNFAFKNEMQQAIINGESIGQMVRRIRGTYNRATGEFVGGIMSKKTHQAATLARTSVINVSNQARLDTYRENKDVLLGQQWVSTLDSATTVICRGLDGLIWNFEYEPVGHSQVWPGATAHWGCRSGQVSVVKPFKNLPKSKQNIKSIRASRGRGKISIEGNYDDWFVKQTKKRQVDILGQGKHKLWKEHKLSSRDMINFNNRPLTIKELELKYGKVA